MKKSSNEALKYAFLHSLITFLIVVVPFHYYITLLIQYKHTQQQINLYKQANIIANKIYEVTDNAKVFEYPRSVLYASQIIDENNKIIFSLINSNIATEDIEKVQIELSKNKLGAKYLIVATLSNNNTVLLQGIYFLLFILSCIFGLSYISMKNSLYSFEEINLKMDRFFKDVMHELKTPLGIMQLNLDMLKLSHPTTKPITRSMSALKTLSTIYDDMEYLIKYKTIQFTKESIDFSFFVHERVEYFLDLANSKNIDFENQIDENIHIFFNRMELQRIIDNTISNAIKYSNPNSTIKINLSIEEPYINFTVLDHGIGIKDTKEIFIRYYRGDLIKGGFGIGLSIVKDICDKHKIKINVTSYIPTHS